MRARLCLGLWLGLGVLCGCEVQRVDACDSSRTEMLTCVNLQLEGGLQNLDLLAVSVSGDWVGHTEAPAQAPFSLPAALAVALPQTFSGSVRLDVQAVQGRTILGEGTALATDLMPGEHRTVELMLR